MPPRHILLTIATGEQCASADEYDTAAPLRWEELRKLLSQADALYFKRVQVVAGLEAEASYEADGIQLEVLVELEGTEDPKGQPPDISKPELQKAVERAFKAGKVLHKKVVPPKPITVE